MKGSAALESPEGPEFTSSNGETAMAVYLEKNESAEIARLLARRHH